MKKLLAFIGIIVVAVALIPWVDGIYTKKYYLQLLSALNQTNNVKMEVLEYNNGWLKSHVKIRYVNLIPSSQASQYQLNGNNQSTNEIIIDETISHGPLVYDPINKQMTFALASVQSNLHLPDNIEKFIFGNNQSNGSLQILSLITFNQDIIVAFKSPMIKINLGNSLNLSWDGLEGNATIIVSNNQVASSKANLTLGTLIMKGDNPSKPGVTQDLTMQPIVINYEGELQPVGVWAGNIGLSLPKLLLNSSDGQNVGVEKLIVSADSDIVGDKFYNLSEKIAFKKLEIPGNPAITVSPASADMSVKNLSVSGVTALMSFLNTLSSHKSQLTPQQIKNQYLTLLAGVITPTTTINSNIQMNTTLGNLSLDGKASLPPNTLNPESLSEAVVLSNATLNIRISAPLTNLLVENAFLNISPARNEAKIETAESKGKAEFNQKIAQMMKEGKLNLTDAMHIMSLQDQNLSQEQFSSDIAQINLPPNIVNELNQLYNESLSHSETAQAIVEAPPSERAKNTIQQWIQQGYLVPENNDYVISITQEAGVIKINGNPLNIPDKPALPSGVAPSYSQEQTTTTNESTLAQ